jgi:hypothetical protein
MASSRDQPSWRWKVTFKTAFRSRNRRSYPGFLFIRPQAKRLVLLDDQDVTVDARFLRDGKFISSGMTLEFACHVAFVGDRVLFVSSMVPAPSVSAPPSLNFARRKGFEADMRRIFGHPINFLAGPGRREFVLVISFGRASFRLDIHTVSIILRSCFGGYAAGFKVKLLKD